MHACMKKVGDHDDHGDRISNVNDLVLNNENDDDQSLGGKSNTKRRRSGSQSSSSSFQWIYT